jgi:serine/threonine protein kinase
MPQRDFIDLDRKVPPFDRFKRIERLASDRSGRASVEHVRHQLYVGREKSSPFGALIKVTTKAGLVYERNLLNEIASLSTINRELPNSEFFPVVREHGRLPDSRAYLIMTLFDEFPLATTIGDERMPHRLVSHLRTALEVSRALAELHDLHIFHVDLNPMNILYRVYAGDPVIKIVDFESSYDASRHGQGEFYDPPTTPGFCAPELSSRHPDARSDLFSLAAVLYTMLAGYQWTWGETLGASVQADQALDPELREILLTAGAQDPEGRYPSVVEFRNALAAYLESIWPRRSLRSSHL